MGYPDMKCMKIKIYVHHMEIDSMFDFVNQRISSPPEYWINPKDLPGSITGGFLEVFVDYDTYTSIREVSEHSNWSDL
jgi:hypothetical protein